MKGTKAAITTLVLSGALVSLAPGKVSAATKASEKDANQATKATVNPQAQLQQAVKDRDAAKQAATNAQAKANAAQRSKAEAEKAESEAQTKLDEANQALQKAQAAKEQATPENIADAEEKLAFAKAQVTIAEATVGDADAMLAKAQQSLDQANEVLASKQSDVKKANDAVSAAEQAVTDAAPKVGEAQKAVDADKQGIEKENGVIKDANKKIAESKDDLVKADDAVKSAQKAADAANKKAQDEKSVFTAPKDLLTKPKGNGVTFNGYTASKEDENKKIKDMSHLTPEEGYEISSFAAGLVNDIRGQLGLPLLKVSTGSVAAAQSAANLNHYNMWILGGDDGVFGPYDVATKLAKASGVPTEKIDNGVGDLVTTAQGAFDSFNSGWSFNDFNSDKSGNMAILKTSVIGALAYLLSNHEYSMVDGKLIEVGPKTGERAWNDMPDFVSSGLLGFDNKSTEYLKDIDYLGVSVHSDGSIGFTGITSKGYSPISSPIDPNAPFFNNTTTPKRESTEAGKTAAEANKALTEAKNNQTNIQKSLDDANKTLEEATSRRDNLTAQLAKDEQALADAKAHEQENATQLAEAQAKLTEAKNNLDKANAALSDAQDVTNAADQGVKDAKSEKARADALVVTANKNVEKAQEYLDSLTNADENLEAAKEAVQTSQEDLTKAQENAQKAEAIAEEATRLAESSKKTLAAAQAKVDKLTRHDSFNKIVAKTEKKNGQKAFPQTGEASEAGMLGLAGTGLLSFLGLVVFNKKRA